MMLYYISVVIIIGVSDERYSRSMVVNTLCVALFVAYFTIVL